MAQSRLVAGEPSSPDGLLAGADGFRGTGNPRTRSAVEIIVDPGWRLLVRSGVVFAFCSPKRRRPLMHRPSAQEFLESLLESLGELPPDFVTRFEEVLRKPEADRSQAIRQLFEEAAGE
jgi:hypothetical protein